jgi:hypothetical protein
VLVLWYHQVRRGSNWSWRDINSIGASKGLAGSNWSWKDALAATAAAETAELAQIVVFLSMKNTGVIFFMIRVSLTISNFSIDFYFI